MGIIRKIFLTAVAVFILAYLLPGIHVSSFMYALLVSLVLGLLRVFVKPLLVLLTLPVTIITFGLFLLIINACIVLLADRMIDHFSVASFGYAILFSILLSAFQGVLFGIFKENEASYK